MREAYFIVTNNPLVFERLKIDNEIKFIEVDFIGLLKVARDLVHSGHKILTHPLSGSVKPGETPYKSIMISKKTDAMDQMSLGLIESAIESVSKFDCKAKKYERFKPEVLEDFQLIDLGLIVSALE